MKDGSDQQYHVTGSRDRATNPRLKGPTLRRQPDKGDQAQQEKPSLEEQVEDGSADGLAGIPSLEPLPESDPTDGVKVNHESEQQ